MFEHLFYKILAKKVRCPRHHVCPVRFTSVHFIGENDEVKEQHSLEEDTPSTAKHERRKKSHFSRGELN